MNLVGVVPISFDMVLYHRFKVILLPIGAGEGTRIEQYFAKVPGKEVPVPYTKMVVLVPAQEKTLQLERSQKMIDSGHPLGHPVVVGVIRLKGKSLVMPKNSAQESFASAGEAHVGPYLPQARTAIANQACAEIIILGHGFRRAEGRPYHVIVEVRRPH